jgi:4-alpha-glucanotransferase
MTSSRLDHFRGFEAYWSIAAEEPTAINGQWVKAPGHALFNRLKEIFGELPFIAEDLGVITREVDELREFFGMPGMRVLQFGFSDRGAHIYLPHRFVENTVVYTGTHDNNTTLGWWRDGATAEERENVADLSASHRARRRHRVGDDQGGGRVGGAICIFPLQDILHLGSEARMNTPSEAMGNWTWRYASGRAAS